MAEGFPLAGFARQVCERAPTEMRPEHPLLMTGVPGALLKGLAIIVAALSLMALFSALFVIFNRGIGRRLFDEIDAREQADPETVKIYRAMLQII